MTEEEQMEFEDFVPKSEKFVNNLDEEEKEWLKKTD
jgi:hypothetical protein